MALSFVACGNGDTNTPTSAAATTSTPAAASTPGTTGAAPGSPADQVGTIGACFAMNTSPDMVEDLRAGETTTAEGVYRTCLEDVLPPAMVEQMEPVIQSAADCGVTAAQNMSDSDVAALESGDEAVAERLSTQTLSCLSTELGIPLS